MRKGELKQIRESIALLTNHYSEIKVELGLHRWLLGGILVTLLGLAAGVIVTGLGG